MRFPPDMQSIRRVRQMIHDMLSAAAEAGPVGDGSDVPEFVDDVVLLASELCENAVLHAGTAFDVAVVADDDEVTVAVTDRGPGAPDRPDVGRKPHPPLESKGHWCSLL